MTGMRWKMMSQADARGILVTSLVLAAVFGGLMIGTFGGDAIRTIVGAFTGVWSVITLLGVAIKAAIDGVDHE